MSIPTDPYRDAAAVAAWLEVECALEVGDVRASARILDGLIAAGERALHDRVMDEVGRRRGLPDWRSYE